MNVLEFTKSYYKKKSEKKSLTYFNWVSNCFENLIRTFERIELLIFEKYF